MSMRAFERSESQFGLEDDCVQVWSGDQDLSAESTNVLEKVLSDDERSRASRFKFERDQVRFVAAHGMLRVLLGRLLRIAPEEVRFEYTKYNKPVLSEEFKSSQVKFNMSHSGGKVLIAFVLGREIGVDIEQIRPDFATGEIAERFFSECEIEKLRSLPAALQAEAFFSCWTRKEAFIKAIGEGLSCPLDQFDVTLAPGEPAALLATRVDGQPASKWSMRSLEVPSGFKAAIVVEGNGWSLRTECWEHLAPRAFWGHSLFEIERRLK